jgi:beta-glucanase (GH16 family)
MKTTHRPPRRRGWPLAVGLATATIATLLAMVGLAAAPSVAATKKTTASTTTTTTTTPPYNPGSYTGDNFPVASTAPGANNAGCGTTTLVKPNGQPWVCTFDDEFNGTTLNPVWTVQQTSVSNYVAGPDCYVNTPQTVNESGGTLNLSVYDSGKTQSCGDHSSKYLAGMVTTVGAFDQTYGLFEVRALIPSTPNNENIKGLQETFWLWPQNPTYGAGNKKSGEIDFAQFYSIYDDLDIPYVKYAEDASDPNVTGDCSYNMGQYNVYGLEWTSTTLTTMVNGQVCMTDTWLPTKGDPTGAPFNEPFFVSLTQALGVTNNAFSTSTPLPATTSIDWMRVWI